jgi:hypothetical protein
VAANNRQAECDKRGPNCRQRELDEQDAARRLAEATTSKATTDRAKALEGQIAAVKGNLDKPVAVDHARHKWSTQPGVMMGDPARPQRRARVAGEARPPGHPREDLRFEIAVLNTEAAADSH